MSLKCSENFGYLTKIVLFVDGAIYEHRHKDLRMTGLMYSLESLSPLTISNEL